MDEAMFDHIGIVAKDLKASARLYAYMLAPLGIKIVGKHRLDADSAWGAFSSVRPQFPFFVIGEGRPGFWPGSAQVSGSLVHLCFSAPSRDAVDRFHKNGLLHGARDNGAPGVRRAPFYCVFLIDLDGNNIEAGCYLHEQASQAKPKQTG